MINENNTPPTKPLKYGRIYWYIFILLLLIGHYFVWIKPLLKYYKLL